MLIVQNKMVMPLSHVGFAQRARAILFGLLISPWLNQVAQAQQLDNSWTVTAGGRTVRVNADGSFRITNIPAPDRFGPGGPGTAPDFVGDDFIRVFGYKTVGGITQYVFSEPFQIRQRQTITVDDLTFTNIPPPLPKSIRIPVDPATLTILGETTQLSVTATLADNSTLDVTTKSAWTSYRSSNPAIITVDPDGLVTAVDPGIAFVTAINGGATSVARIIVSPDDPLTTVEGFVHFDDGSPAPQVKVVLPQTGDEFITTNSGFFSFENVPASLGISLTVVTLTNGNQIIFGGVAAITPSPNLITDVGIIRLAPFSFGDTDADGVSDDAEILAGLDPNDPDTDGDGTLDGNEDADADGLSDAIDILLGLNPQLSDSDGDGILDRDEDRDFDGLSNGAEINTRNTNPFLIDTDGDSWTDFAEVSLGTDPTDPSSRPQDNEQRFAISNPTAFVNIGNQSAAEFQVFAISKPTAFVNIGNQSASEFQSFSINPSTSFDNSP